VPPKTPTVPTADEPRERARWYLAKAVQRLQDAEETLARERYDSAAGLAVLAAINGGDASCVARAGVRAAGKSHADAVRLIRQLLPGDELAQRASNQLANVVGLKNEIEYEARRTTAKDATELVGWARRIVRWAAETVEEAERTRPGRTNRAGGAGNPRH